MCLFKWHQEFPDARTTIVLFDNSVLNAITGSSTDQSFTNVEEIPCE